MVQSIPFLQANKHSGSNLIFFVLLRLVLVYYFQPNALPIKKVSKMGRKTTERSRVFIK